MKSWAILGSQKISRVPGSGCVCGGPPGCRRTGGIAACLPESRQAGRVLPAQRACLAGSCRETAPTLYRQRMDGSPGFSKRAAMPARVGFLSGGGRSGAPQAKAACRPCGMPGSGRGQAPCPAGGTPVTPACTAEGPRRAAFCSRPRSRRGSSRTPPLPCT